MKAKQGRMVNAWIGRRVFMLVVCFLCFISFIQCKQAPVLSKAKGKSGVSSIKRNMRKEKLKSRMIKDKRDRKLKWEGESGNLFGKIIRQSLYEQEVEDANSLHRMQENLVRRLIVMPLSDSFKAIQIDAMHQKVQYGDKCSLPSSLGKYIFDHRLEVPWIFEIKPISIESHSATGSLSSNDYASSFAPIRKDSLKKRYVIDSNGKVSDIVSRENVVEGINSLHFKKGKLSKAYISPLDFRSPENYIFLPKWLMNDLNLLPNDLVEISLVRIKLADLVVLQPVTADWDDLISEHTDPKTLLEHEINKYSSLTSGSTIAIKVKDKEYPIYVKETRAEGGTVVHGVRVQDSDIKTDIDRSVVDKLVSYRDAQLKTEEQL